MGDEIPQDLLNRVTEVNSGIIRIKYILDYINPDSTNNRLSLAIYREKGFVRKTLDKLSNRQKHTISLEDPKFFNPLARADVDKMLIGGIFRHLKLKYKI